MQGTSSLRGQSPSVSLCLGAAPSPVLGQGVSPTVLSAHVYGPVWHPLAEDGHGDSSSSRSTGGGSVGVVIMRRGHFVPGVWCDQCPLNLAKANTGDWVSAQGEKQKDQSHHATGPGTDQSRVSMQMSQGLWGRSLPLRLSLQDPGSLHQCPEIGHNRIVLP